MKLINETSKIKATNKLDTNDVKSWLSQYTSNTLIHSYFFMICGLYFVIPYYLASTGEFIRSLTSLNKHQSVGYPNGGCISIPLAFTEAIKKFGGEVKTKTVTFFQNDPSIPDNLKTIEKKIHKVVEFDKWDQSFVEKKKIEEAVLQLLKEQKIKFELV